MISYFTDGSASPNPGPGGFAVIKNGAPFIIGGEPEDSPVPRDNTTNIRMEARAIFSGMDDFISRKNNTVCKRVTLHELFNLFGCSRRSGNGNFIALKCLKDEV